MSLFHQQNIQFWNVLFEKKTPIGQAYKKTNRLDVNDFRLYLSAFQSSMEKKTHKGQIKDRGH